MKKGTTKKSTTISGISHMSNNFNRTDQVIAAELQKIHRLSKENVKSLPNQLTINATASESECSDNSSSSSSSNNNHINKFDRACTSIIPYGSYDATSNDDDEDTRVLTTINDKDYKDALYHSDRVAISMSDETTNHEFPQDRREKDDNHNDLFPNTPNFLIYLHSSDIFLMLNISVYSILGFLLRYYLNELFHSGCNTNNGFDTTSPNLLCVTSTTSAIFTDLPANMLGCFFMGFMSTATRILKNNRSSISFSTSKTVSNIPWINSKHHFQNWSNIHLAIRTGFCGSLTTFASWNAQMVSMICSWNISLIISALFGYVIGVNASYMSLKFGQHVSLWIYSCYYYDHDEKLQEENDDNDIGHIQDDLEIRRHQVVQKEQVYNQQHMTTSSMLMEILHLLIPYLIAIPLLVYYIYLSEYKNVVSTLGHRNTFREVWLSALCAPLGSLLRWRLSLSFNKQHPWLPLGTFYANVFGSIVSITAVSFLLLTSVDNWTQDILIAIKSGFAGCLSTVSTFMDEFDNMLDKFPTQAKAYRYVYQSLAVACIASIFIYAPMSYAYKR